MTNDNPAVIPGHTPQSAVEAQEALEVLIRLSNAQASGALTEPVPVQPPSRSAAPTKPTPAIRVFPEGEDRALVSGGPGDRHRSISRGGHRPRYCYPIHMAPGENAPGALKGRYEIPAAVNREHPLWVVLPLTVLLLSGFVGRRLLLSSYVAWPALTIWLAIFANTAFQWLASWWDHPCAVTPRQQRLLDHLRVTVAIPAYNEDPGLLDQGIWSIVNQSRPPQRIHVVDDGSTKVDYRHLRDHWEGITPNGVEVVWTRQPNGGKKHAQATAFVADEAADIFITVDSDTCLEYRAIEEGLKPFSNPANASVAGFELVHNAMFNWLTIMVSIRSMIFELVAWGAQSALGEVTVNRGSYALYRASVIREIVPAYLGETFWGHPIKLGDDSALTLFSRGRGRTVQQITAISFSTHPQTLKHHFKQRTRWARGSTIRDCWRLRYLPLSSYGWWYTITRNFLMLSSLIATIEVIATWPVSADYVVYLLAWVIVSSYLFGLRTLGISRSDQTGWHKALALAASPAVALWGLMVWRWIKLYGVCTFLNQGWVTRVGGVEVGIDRATGDGLPVVPVVEGAVT